MKLSTGNVTALIVLASVIVIGGFWSYTVYRGTKAIETVSRTGAVIIDKGSKLVDTAKEADYGKIKDTAADLADRIAAKTGELTDKATNKSVETIGKLRDAWKNKRETDQK